MKNNTLDDPTIIHTVSIYLTRYVMIVSIVLGLIGTILNITIFTSKRFKYHSCSIYFLAASFDAFLIIYFALFTLLLEHGYNIKVTGTSLIYCKIQQFAYYVSTTFGSYCIVLASFDRYVTTLSKWKHKKTSDRSNAIKLTIFTLIIIILFNLHVLIYFHTWNFNCVPMLIYEMFFSWFTAIFCSVAPPMLLVTFGLLTIYNINQMGKNEVIGKLQRKDHYFIRMILIQIFIMFLFMYPFALCRIWTAGTIHKRRSAQEKFALLCLQLLKYVGHMSTFYVVTLTTNDFWAELKCLKDCLSQAYKTVRCKTK